MRITIFSKSEMSGFAEKLAQHIRIYNPRSIMVPMFGANNYANIKLFQDTIDSFKYGINLQKVISPFYKNPVPIMVIGTNPVHEEKIFINLPQEGFSPEPGLIKTPEFVCPRCRTEKSLSGTNKCCVCQEQMIRRG